MLAQVLLLFLAAFCCNHRVQCSSCVAAKVMAGSSTPCGLNPKEILQYTTIRNLDKVVTSCTEAYFCSSSSIHVERRLLIQNLHNVSFIGLNHTTLDCRGSTGMQFINITNLLVKNLQFLNCGENYSINISHKGDYNYTFWIGVNVFNCTNTHFKKVRVSQSKGIGLLLLNTAGTNVIYKCRFEFNGREAIFGGTGLSIELSNYNISYRNLEGSVYTIDNCTFRGNIAYVDAESAESSPFGRGGGLHVIARYNSSNNTINITNCYFVNNLAMHGGGLYAYFFDRSAHNKLSLYNCMFDSNSSPAGTGGGYTLGFYSPVVGDPCKNNTILVDSCCTVGNRALRGGGLSLTSTRMPSSMPLDSYNKVTHRNCTWTNNSAHYGAAIIMIPDHWSLLTEGALPQLLFENCIIQSNSILDNNVTGGHELEKPFHQSTMGAGGIYVMLYNIIFNGSLLVENNNGSAILGSSSILTFSNGSTVNFTGNSGYVGGAVHLIGYSIINVSKNSIFSFSNNTALTDGGAIYHQSPDIVEHAYSYNCFISRSPSIDKDSLHFEFSGNLAGQGDGNTGNGNSIYSTSLLPCMREYNSSLTHLGNFVFDGNQSDEVASTVSSFSSEPLNSSKPYIPIIPGKYTYLEFEGYDDSLIKRHAVYVATIQNHNNGSIRTSDASQYVIKNMITLLGTPGDEAIVFLTTLTKHKTVLSFQVRINPCPPGYVLKFKSGGYHCVCSTETDTFYTGIYSCDAFLFKAKRSRGFWVGYKKNFSINDDSSLISGYCPKGYCQYNTEDLPMEASPERLNDNVCKKNRKGVLCSKCTHNTTAYYHSLTFKCGGEDLCHIGWLFYLVSEILPVTIFFLGIIIMNASFTSGSLNGFIFYAQVIGFFKITINSRIQLTRSTYVLSQLNYMAYNILNLQFFTTDELAFCLYKGANALHLLMFQYCTVFYALFLVLFIILVFRLCNHRQVKSLFQCRVNSIQASMIHGLSAFLVLCFAKCAHVSTVALSFGLIRGKGEEIVKTVVFVYGDYDWLSLKHLNYIVPSLLIGIVIVVIPLVILLSYPLCFKCLASLKLRDARCTSILCKPVAKMKPFLDSLQGCYKDNCRFFSGLYFLYRIIILLNHSLNLTAYFYITLEVQIILMLLLHSLVQPYKEKRHNAIDTLLFSNMAIINGISMLNYTQSFAPRVYNNTEHIFLIIQEILMLMPLVCVLLYYAYTIGIRTIAVKFLKRMSKLDTEGDLLDYCDISSSRLETIPSKRDGIYYNTF